LRSANPTGPGESRVGREAECGAGLVVDRFMFTVRVDGQKGSDI